MSCEVSQPWGGCCSVVRRQWMLLCCLNCLWLGCFCTGTSPHWRQWLGSQVPVMLGGFNHPLMTGSWTTNYCRQGCLTVSFSLKSTINSKFCWHWTGGCSLSNMLQDCWFNSETIFQRLVYGVNRGGGDNWEKSSILNCLWPVCKEVRYPVAECGDQAQSSFSSQFQGGDCINELKSANSIFHDVWRLSGGH